MSTTTEVKALAATYEMMRNLSKFYLSKLGEFDIHKVYEIDGKKFNSAHWLAAHLVWTEDFLILGGLGDKDSGIPWLEEYGFGSNPEEVKTKPSLEEIMTAMDDVHKQAMEIINSLTDEDLDKENHIKANFGGKNNKRVVLMHAIRHEPMHIGQISWILKANGIKMV